MSWFESILNFCTLHGSGCFIYLIICTVLPLAFVYLLKRQRKVWLIEQIPGPKGLPFLGNALEFNVSGRELFALVVDKLCDYDSSVSRAWVGFQPYVLIYKSSSAEVILNSNRNLAKSKDYEYLHPWLGTGLLTSSGAKWHSRRKLLTHTFHFKILEDFISIFNRQSSVLLKNLETHLNGKPFNIYTPITLCTLDIILESAMGTSINAQNNAESDYVKAIYKIGTIAQMRMARPWLQPDILFSLLGYRKVFDNCIEILHDFSKKTIAERRKMYMEEKRPNEARDKPESEDESLNTIYGKRNHLAFLDLLLESSKGGIALTDEDIREEVDTFMFEGHDTSAAAINWCLYLLGSHPEIQDKVVVEMNAIFEGSDRPATVDDLREMKYLECCIKEALRLFPSVPYFARRLDEDILIDGYTIPAGTITTIVTYRLHRDPSQFPDPELFQPERFLPQNSVKRNSFAYVPFSAGPRNCIGQKFALMEEKVVLSSFLRKYKIESTVKREDLKLVGELILRPEDGIIVKIFPR